MQSPQASTIELTARQITPKLRNSKRVARATSGTSDSVLSFTTRKAKA